MDIRIIELLKKCMDNKITFEYAGHVEELEVRMLVSGSWVLYENGYVNRTDQDHNDAVVERLHNAVDEYLEGLRNE